MNFKHKAGRYRISLAPEHKAAPMNLLTLTTKGVSRASAELLLAGRPLTNQIDVRTVERLVASRQLIIEDTSAAPGHRVVPSQVKVLILSP